MGYVDIMSTMSNNMFCTLYLSCYELRWTIPLLISIANYIFSLLLLFVTIFEQYTRS